MEDSDNSLDILFANFTQKLSHAMKEQVDDIYVHELAKKIAPVLATGIGNAEIAHEQFQARFPQLLEEFYESKQQREVSW